MLKKMKQIIVLLCSVLILASCSVEEIIEDLLADHTTENQTTDIVTIDDLNHTNYFKKGALEHILEGELNRKGQAVGFHYDGLPSKKGEVISGTETEPNDLGVYEAKVIISDVKKTSNNGKSSFFPNEWTAQDVVDAINEAYDNRSLITGNTYEGLTEEGQVIRMYVDQQEHIISAFPVY